MSGSDLVEVMCDRLTRSPADRLDDDARTVARQLLPLADVDDQDALARAAIARMRGLGPLDELFADPLVNEVMINNGGNLWIEREGSLRRVGVLSPDEAPRLIERILNPLGRRLDRLSPIVDARLADGSRVCA